MDIISPEAVIGQIDIKSENTEEKEKEEKVEKIIEDKE